MPTLNAEKYGSVVAEYDCAPKMIESEREYRGCREALERLLFPSRKLSAEEDALAKLLIHLIGLYEDRVVVAPRTSPRQVLQHLMEQRRLKQRDVVAVFGTASIVSEILSGKREINAKQARKLADFFSVPADLFIS
jgi:HTH-type transcriptional regulator / antitoxin HigA